MGIQIFDGKFLKKIMLIWIGVMIMGFGLAINIANNWGSDPVTVFAQSLTNILGKIGVTFLTVGRALILMNMVVFVIMVFIYKLKYVNWGTFAGMFCVGLFTDFWTGFLADMVLNNNGFGFKTLWMILGTVSLAVGIGIYAAVDMGASPLDLISITISEKLGVNYAKVRMICDLCFLVLGWLFGGIVGVATVLCMLLIGPISGLVIQNIKKIFEI